MGMAEDARTAWESLLSICYSRENEERFQQLAEQEELTRRALHALLDLPEDEPVAMSHLAARWFCDASNVTAIIDVLEKRRLVDRTNSVSDRRVKLVFLTEKGTATRHHCREVLLTPILAFNHLSAAELKTLRGLIAKVAAGFEPAFTASVPSQVRGGAEERKRMRRRDQRELDESEGRSPDRQRRKDLRADTRAAERLRRRDLREMARAEKVEKVERAMVKVEKAKAQRVERAMAKVEQVEQEKAKAEQAKPRQAKQREDERLP